MANEINKRHSETGSTLYFTDESAAGLIRNSTADVAFSVSDWATYAQAMAETPSGGYRYLGTKPDTASGKRRITVFKRIGAAPAITDELLSPAEIGWSVGREVSLLLFQPDSILYLRSHYTGLTFYATIEAADGTVWNGSALETMLAANWGDYDIPMPETPAGSYRYIANIPALATGRYKVKIFLQVGAAPDITDPQETEGEVVVFTALTPIRSQIMTALEARMATITTANGYRTDVGENVFIWKAGPFLSDEVPGMDIRDSDTFRDETVGEQEHTLDINIRAISSGDTSPETVRQIQADIIEAVGTDVTFGGLADDTGTITAEQIDVETADAVKSGCGVRFTITYLTERFTA